MMVTKKDYLLRYSTFWGDVFIRLFAPIGVVVWQFGFFKVNASIFGQIQGSVIIACLIAVFGLKQDAQEFLKELENQGWYKSIKETLVWLLVFVILILSYNFIEQMLWIVGSFLGGSVASIFISPIHTKYKNKIKRYKEKQKEGAI